MVLSPNGMDNPELICIVYVRKQDGGVLSATSDKFMPCEDYVYEEFYPTVHLHHLSERIKKFQK